MKREHVGLKVSDAIQISINKLHFYPQNPRREPMDDEDDIRAALCNDEGVINLANHISQNGLSPLDRIAVVPHSKLDGHYVVVEGNRRLCALQLLRDPARAPSPSARKIFQALNKAGESVAANVEVVRFRTLDAARIWMSVKHEGEQGGIGTVEWDATQKTRFNRQGGTGKTRPKNPNVQALAMLDYAVSKEIITKDDRGKIALTTVTRYLTNPNVRAAIGLLNSENLTTNADLGQFDSVVRGFLSDAIPTGDTKRPAAVSSRSSSSDRNSYAEKLRRSGLSPVTRDEAPYIPSAVQKPDGSGGNDRRRSRRSPDLRRQLVRTDFKQVSKDAALGRMVKEGRELCVDDAVFSCNYLLRAIFERIVILYANKYAIGKTRELDKLISRCSQHAASSGNPKAASRSILQILNKAANNRHESYSPDTLGAGVHGGKIPKSSDLKRDWDTLQPVFEWMLSCL